MKYAFSGELVAFEFVGLLAVIDVDFEIGGVKKFDGGLMIHGLKVV